jgi:hypothetical protein
VRDPAHLAARTLPTDSEDASSYDGDAIWNVRPTTGKLTGDSMQARVIAHSQTYRLRERMSEVEIRHGQEVRADLPGIRVTAGFEGWRTASDPNTGAIFFCTMGPIRIREVLNRGDGAPLPTEVVLENLVVPGPGAYDIMNALVHSNGALRIQVDSETEIVPRAQGLVQGWV